MDQEFDRRWRAALPPFDGMILSMERPLPLSRLQPLLQTAALCLHHEWRTEELLTLQDWHEHDGYVTTAATTRWDELLRIVSSHDHLPETCTGETYVSTAYFPGSRAFYFRISIPDAADQPQPTDEWIGTFDLTGPAWLLDRVQTAFPGATHEEFIREPAREYFNRTWSG
jgi:hypothetical protein